MGETWNDIAVLAIQRDEALCECSQRMQTLRGDDIEECVK